MMEKAKDPEEAYLDALKDAFNLKTPAQHLADSKYLGLGRGLTAKVSQKLMVEQNPHLFKPPIWLSLDVERGTAAFARQSEKATATMWALLKRLRRGKTVKWVVVQDRTGR